MESYDCTRPLDEKRRPLGIEKLRRRRHDAGEQGIEVQLGGDCLGDRQQLELLLPGLFEPLHQMHLLERARGVAIDRLEKGGIDLGTAPRARVQYFGYAYDLSGEVA